MGAQTVEVAVFAPWLGLLIRRVISTRVCFRSKLPVSSLARPPRARCNIGISAPLCGRIGNSSGGSKDSSVRSTGAYNFTAERSQLLTSSSDQTAM